MVTNEGRVLDALGDASRRELLNRLAAGPASVRQLSDAVPISRPAVSQHLKVLLDAGLVTAEPHGTRRIYSVAPEGVGMLREYLETLWRAALHDFAEVAARKATPDKT